VLDEVSVLPEAKTATPCLLMACTVMPMLAALEAALAPLTVQLLVGSACSEALMERSV